MPGAEVVGNPAVNDWILIFWVQESNDDATKVNDDRY